MDVLLPALRRGISRHGQGLALTVVEAFESATSISVEASGSGCLDVRFDLGGVANFSLLRHAVVRSTAIGNEAFGGKILARHPGDQDNYTREVVKLGLQTHPLSGAHRSPCSTAALSVADSEPPSPTPRSGCEPFHVDLSSSCGSPCRDALEILETYNREWATAIESSCCAALCKDGGFLPPPMRHASWDNTGRVFAAATSIPVPSLVFDPDLQDEPETEGSAHVEQKPSSAEGSFLCSVPFASDMTTSRSSTWSE